MQIIIDPVPCPDCEYFACICNIRARHAQGCKFRTSATCAIPIACDHGFDVCPDCDPCTCGAGIENSDF